MPHVLVAGKLHPSGKRILAEAPEITTTFIENALEETYIPHAPEADALLIRTQPLRAETIAKAGRLKMVSRHGVGYDAVDVAALNARGIPLAICADVNSTSVAEQAAMMILAAKKRALQADASVRRGQWEWRNQLHAQDLRGQALLLVGYGRIGRHVGAMMARFGMEIRAYDPFAPPSADGVPMVDALADGLAWADVISFSVPHTGAPLIGEAEFAAMKDGVVLVNTSRGGVLDEGALVEALRSGKVGAAGLDVFQTEPLSANHPLTDFDQVILSPHIAGLTAGAAERMAVSSAQNILDFFAGRLDPALVVNREAIDAAPQT